MCFSKQDFTPASVPQRAAPAGWDVRGKVGKRFPERDDVLAVSFPADRTGHRELSIRSGDLQRLLLGAGGRLLCMACPCRGAQVPSNPGSFCHANAAWILASHR